LFSPSFLTFVLTLLYQAKPIAKVEEVAAKVSVLDSRRALNVNISLAASFNNDHERVRQAILNFDEDGRHHIDWSCHVHLCSLLFALCSLRTRILRSICNSVSTELDDEHTGVLLKICPTPAELKLVREYDGDASNLNNVDRRWRECSCEEVYL
jgi:hypothetical protein